MGDSYESFGYVNDVSSWSTLQKMYIRTIGRFAFFMAASRIKSKSRRMMMIELMRRLRLVGSFSQASFAHAPSHLRKHYNQPIEIQSNDCLWIAIEDDQDWCRHKSRSDGAPSVAPSHPARWHQTGCTRCACDRTRPLCVSTNLFVSVCRAFFSRKYLVNVYLVATNLLRTMRGVVLSTWSWISTLDPRWIQTLYSGAQNKNTLC